MIFIPGKGGAKVTPFVLLAIALIRFAVGLASAFLLSRAHAGAVLVALTFTFALPMVETLVLNPVLRRARLHLDAANEDDPGKEIGE
jgi:hypothetical protein